MDKRLTLILGASPNRNRYSYIAAKKLINYNHEIVLVGLHKGDIEGYTIYDINKKPDFENIDTITLYMNPPNQKAFYEYILGLKPKRLIFNPGTENPELVRLAKKMGIETVFDCTLIMLSFGKY